LYSSAPLLLHTLNMPLCCCSSCCVICCCLSCASADVPDVAVTAAVAEFAAQLTAHLMTRGMIPCCSGMQCSALPVPIV
jgi:hypothetical protein